MLGETGTQPNTFRYMLNKYIHIGLFEPIRATYSPVESIGSETVLTIGQVYTASEMSENELEKCFVLRQAKG